MSIFRHLGFYAMCTLAGAAIGFAAWTVDAAGFGFVGKGDVQLALGLNNAQLQAQAGNLAFSYSDVAEYDVPCMKDNGRQVLRNTFNRTQTVNATVAYDARNRNQVTGFYLNGFSGNPVVGSGVSCPGGWEADGAPVLVSASGGMLSVNGIALAPSAQ